MNTKHGGEKLDELVVLIHMLNGLVFGSANKERDMWELKYRQRKGEMGWNVLKFEKMDDMFARMMQLSETNSSGMSYKCQYIPC